MASAGRHHSLAVLEDGLVSAWGSNDSGQLGDGSTLDSASQVIVWDLKRRAIAVAAGDHHSLALLADGSVWAWGGNDCGQLGYGRAKDSVTPILVQPLMATVIAVSAGSYHNIALLANGTVWCWGCNAHGQLGNSSTVDCSSPRPVLSLGSDTIKICCGALHNLAMKADGSVWAWGWNDRGQLGNGSSISKTAPIQVRALGAKVTAFAGGYSHSLAVKENGSVWAWGSNSNGQLGDDSRIDSAWPVSVRGLGLEAKSVAAGESHSVALQVDGTVWAWGWNGGGQLGDGSTVDSSTPLLVRALLSTVPVTVSIAAGAFHSVACAAATGNSGIAPGASDRIIEWGWHGESQLGERTQTCRVKLSRIRRAHQLFRGIVGPCLRLPHKNLKEVCEFSDIGINDASPDYPMFSSKITEILARDHEVSCRHTRLLS